MSGAMFRNVHLYSTKSSEDATASEKGMYMINYFIVRTTILMLPDPAAKYVPAETPKKSNSSQLLNFTD